MVIETSYQKDPIQELSKTPLDLLLNLSASPFHVGKFDKRLHICQKAANTLHCPVIYCNQIGGNDSLIFDGYSLVVNKNAELSTLLKGFEEDFQLIDTSTLNPISRKENDLQDLYDALILGIRDYFHKLGLKKGCIGLSGGIDSALVACLAEKALGKENVLAVAMPSRYSSQDSLNDAAALAKNLDIRFRVIPIEDPFHCYLELLTPYFEGKPQDTTEENLQARIRGMILMALSNKLGYVVLSTGNKSELAMGYSTLYGDTCGGLAAISDLTKEEVYKLCYFINQKAPIIPENTLKRAPSAELRPGQKDTDSLPEYPIVDAVLKAYIEEGKSPAEIAKTHTLDLKLVESLIKKIHTSEYKRRQTPPGLRVTEKAFSIGRRFPIVQGWV